MYWEVVRELMEVMGILKAAWKQDRSQDRMYLTVAVSRLCVTLLNSQSPWRESDWLVLDHRPTSLAVLRRQRRNLMKGISWNSLASVFGGKTHQYTTHQSAHDGGEVTPQKETRAFSRKEYWIAKVNIQKTHKCLRHP